MASILHDLRGVREVAKADGGIAYQVTVSKGIDPRTGQQKRRYKTFTPPAGMSKRDIKAEIERIRVELGAGSVNANSKESRKSFAAYATEYIDMRERSGKFKPRTAASYRRLLPVIRNDFGNLPLNEITPGAIEAFYDKLRKCGSSASLKTMTAKPAFGQYIKENRVTGVSIAKAAGIAQCTFRRAKNGDPVTQEVAAKIASACEKKTSELFEAVPRTYSLSERTIQLYAHFIGGVFSSAVKKGIIKENPVRFVDPPSPIIAEAHSIDSKTLAEVFQRIIDEPLRWRLIVHLLAFTGARRGEIAALQWEDIDLAGGIVHIRHSLNYTKERGVFLDLTKTRSIRTVKIPAQVVDMLHQYKAEQSRYILLRCGDYDNQGYLFAQDNGKPSNPGTITAWFCRFAKRTGINGLRAHAFRHCAASIMIASGVDVVTVASILGHTDPTTTERVYAHALEEARTRATDCIADVIYSQKQA